MYWCKVPEETTREGHKVLTVPRTLGLFKLHNKTYISFTSLPLNFVQLHLQCKYMLGIWIPRLIINIAVDYLSWKKDNIHETYVQLTADGL